MNGGIVMYRIAVIQNEVEMQHSGYVDSVPKYRKQDFDLHEHVLIDFQVLILENYLLKEKIIFLIMIV